MSYPGIKIVFINKRKISDELGSDEAVVKFAPLKTIIAWEARAGGLFASSGLLLGKSDHVFPSSDLFPSPTTFPSSYKVQAENVLLYPSIDGAGWSKGYNTNIVYTQDGPDQDSPTVATFNDASGNSSSYWYSYGNYAPQDPATDYVIALWVKVESGYTDIRCYTGDNTESSNYGSNARLFTSYERASDYEGWKLLIWELTTNNPWYSDSLSFYIRGSWHTGKLALSAPIMVKKSEIEFIIGAEELQQDGEYEINVYGCDYTDGEWTPRHQSSMVKVRYIRDWLNGSTSNSGDHWVQLSAFDKDENNVALNKPVTSSTGSGSNLLKVTDGTTTYSGYASISSVNPCYVEIDLGSVYEIEKVELWHYWADGRTYYDTKTEVSEDGINWVPVFNSKIEGEYQETSSGKLIII